VSPPTSKDGRPRIPPRPAPEEAGADARERIIRTAYELFTQNGHSAVGVDRIVAEAGVAKTTLYRHFRSKDELVGEVLERHHQLWLLDWLAPQARARGGSPAEQLLALFDSFEEWFGDQNFQGCLLLNSVLETHDRSRAAHRAAVRALDDVYALLERLAVEATARDPQRLAKQIHLLMRGSIMAATEGHPETVHEARAAAQLLLREAVPGR
jgi:AcrR family transcriptional regulator